MKVAKTIKIYGKCNIYGNEHKKSWKLTRRRKWRRKKSLLKVRSASPWTQKDTIEHNYCSTILQLNSKYPH